MAKGAHATCIWETVGVELTSELKNDYSLTHVCASTNKSVAEVFHPSKTLDNYKCLTGANARRLGKSILDMICILSRCALLASWFSVILLKKRGMLWDTAKCEHAILDPFYGTY